MIELIHPGSRTEYRKGLKVRGKPRNNQLLGWRTWIEQSPSGELDVGELEVCGQSAIF
jgi:hypothetical protein